MRKSCKRKVRDPMDCINSRMKLADDQTRDIGLAYHIALDCMMTEHANESAWSTLACSLNVALLLSEQGIHADAEPMIKLAQDALMTIRKRALSTGEWRINLAHHQKQSLFAAINAHDLQCATATKAQVSAALLEVHRRVSAGCVFV